MKVLVPVNQDPLSLSILDTVGEMLRLVPGVQVHLATVIDPRSVHGLIAGEEVTAGGAGTLVVRSPLPKVVESHGEALLRVEQERREELQEIAAARLPGLECTCHVKLSEHPAQAIVGLADEVGADLIAMATHGRSGVSRLVLGSVTASVIHDSGRPVLVRRRD
jgi:nucleotide-binding universal stress UspA family protein